MYTWNHFIILTLFDMEWWDPNSLLLASYWQWAVGSSGLPNSSSISAWIRESFGLCWTLAQRDPKLSEVHQGQNSTCQVFSMNIFFFQVCRVMSCAVFFCEWDLNKRTAHRPGRWRCFQKDKWESIRGTPTLTLLEKVSVDVILMSFWCGSP
jgi:hypothetical protein